MPLRFSRGGCKGQNPAPHNAIVENTPGFPHRVEKTVDFSPPFSQPVENYVEKHGMHSRMQPPQTANPGIAAEKHAPAVLWICIKIRTDKFPKPTASPTGCPQMPVDRTPGFPTENRKKSVHNDRFVAVGTPPDTQKSPQNRPRTRISTIRQGKIRIFRTEPRRQKRQKVPAVAGYSGFPQFPAPYCSCFWMEG